jgi:beta-lactamase regulating signal transducer with metallopeptidase domain
MQDFIIYFAKVNITLSILFLIYWLLLRNEKFFQLNRFILLSILVVAVFLPLIPFQNFLAVSTKPLKTFHERLSKVPLMQTLVASDKGQLSEKSDLANSTRVSESTSFNLFIFQVGVAIYLLIALLFFIRFVCQLLQLSKLLKGNETKKNGNIVYHTTEKKLPPFSFFRHIVVSTSHFETNQIEQILAHEKVHIKQWHMIDILLVELLQMFCWINPFVWVLNRTVKLNLEYIADEQVLNSGFDRKAYQINILTSCLNPVEFELANLFTSSKIKLRIKMMNEKSSPRIHVIKYVLLLPVITVLYFMINPIVANASDRRDSKQVAVTSSLTQDGTPLILAVRRGNLELVKKLLEEGADINLSSPGDGNPLINACLYGKEQIALFLIDKGADVNALVEGDETPLINACRNGNLRIVQYLFTHGAKVDLAVLANEETRPELRSPLNQAIQYKHPAIEVYLREKGAKQ